MLQGKLILGALGLTATAVAMLSVTSVPTTRVERAAATPNGETVYNQSCASCHQSNGQGVPGVFPPLVGVVPQVLKNGCVGRATLTQVVAHGMQGSITVKGVTYNGVMPPWQGQLSDAQIVNVLNYVSTAWGHRALLPKTFKPFTLTDVHNVSGKAALTPQQVHAAWLKLNLK
ncbi:c-type cytochrome [Deinococcus pimensis]|uniref:c-type cytochrome n=1 Tax=Deinococcus pimensis TaxID=309888 RepID=UPI0004B80672|nr:cytochrome c [Deinococcus pimensis]